jgi:3-mercaptopropionate dioxygenase
MSRSAASAVAPRPTDTAMTEVVGSCPAPLTAAIRREVYAGGSWQDTADRVAAVLRRGLPAAARLAPGRLAGDPSGYRTCLVHAEHDGSFSIVLMVMRPGQRTPVHDHLTWCVSAVLQGTEYEEIFALRDGYLEVIARNRNEAGTVNGFAPPGDIHQVRHDGTGIAISMHVYGTDIARVASSIRREYPLPIR